MQEEREDYLREPAPPSRPVCVRCGLTEGASMTEMERRQIEYHPFVPAPPPSEEAEAQVTSREQQEAREQFKALTESRRPKGEWDELTHARFAVEAYLQVGLRPIGQLEALKYLIALEAATRRPIEEELRVALANQDRLAAVLDMGGQLDQVTERAERAEEERDRLSRAVIKVTADYVREKFRAEAAEAQVQELMAALGKIDGTAREAWDARSKVSFMRRLAREALAAHQEEGESVGEA